MNKTPDQRRRERMIKFMKDKHGINENEIEHFRKIGHQKSTDFAPALLDQHYPKDLIVFGHPDSVDKNGHMFSHCNACGMALYNIHYIVDKRKYDEKKWQKCIELGIVCGQTLLGDKIKSDTCCKCLDKPAFKNGLCKDCLPKKKELECKKEEKTNKIINETKSAVHDIETGKIIGGSLYFNPSCAESTNRYLALNSGRLFAPHRY